MCVCVYNSMYICSKNPTSSPCSRQAAAFQVDAQGIHRKTRWPWAVRLGILRIRVGTRGLRPKVHPFCWVKQCQKLTTQLGIKYHKG